MLYLYISSANFIQLSIICMEYRKKSLSNLDIQKDYEEIDTRLASGWYVDDIDKSKKKIYKTKKTTFKISKKLT